MLDTIYPVLDTKYYCVLYVYVCMYIHIYIYIYV